MKELATDVNVVTPLISLLSKSTDASPWNGHNLSEKAFCY